MSDNKDRLGDKLSKREKAEEDRYFAEQEAAKLAKLKAEAEREAAVGRCPRDGAALDTQDHHGISTEVCPTCRGVWLDKGELEAIEKRDDEHWPTTWFRSILGD